MRRALSVVAPEDWACLPVTVRRAGGTRAHTHTHTHSHTIHTHKRTHSLGLTLSSHLSPAPSLGLSARRGMRLWNRRANHVPGFVFSQLALPPDLSRLARNLPGKGPKFRASRRSFAASSLDPRHSCSASSGPAAGRARRERAHACFFSQVHDLPCPLPTAWHNANLILKRPGRPMATAASSRESQASERLPVSSTPRPIGGGALLLLLRSLGLGRPRARRRQLSHPVHPHRGPRERESPHSLRGQTLR